MCKSKSFYFLKFFSSLISSLIISNLVYAQITIEEKVEIEPRSAVFSPNNLTSTNTIRIEMQWTPATTPAYVLAYSLPCQSPGSSNFESDGDITYLVENVSAGSHSLQFRFNIPCGNPQLVNGQYQIFFNDQLVQSNSFFVGGCYSGSSYPFYNFSYAPPLISNYGFNLDNNESCILNPTPMTIFTYNNCATGVSWNKDTQPLNLTFTSGGEFASFYDNNQQMIGDNFSGTFSEFQDIKIIQDNVYNGSGDKYFIVQCEWDGVVRTDSVKLISQNNGVIVANTSGFDSLYTGQTVKVELYPNDFGGQCTVFFPLDATYNTEIVEGNEYGNLIEPNTGEHVQSFTELSQSFGYAYFDYVADGISPDTTKSIIIRISSSDPEIPYTDLMLYIKPPPLYVYTEPEIVFASDTADVIVKKRNTDGTLEDFPPEQTFELAVIDGCINGNILVGNSVGVYFADALQPIKFVTADSLESDSGYVRLRVGTNLSELLGPTSNVIENEKNEIIERQEELLGGIGYSRAELRAGFERKIEEKNTERLTKKTKTNGEPSPEAPIVEACFIGGSTYSVYWEGDVYIVNEPELIIIYPSINSPNELITDEPQMPNVICKAQLKNYSGGPLTFEWEYEVTYTYKRFTYDRDGNQVNLCSRISTTTFKGISHSYDEIITEWEVPFIKDSASFNYQGIYRNRCNQVISTYEDVDDIFTGGYVFVELTVKDRYDEIISSVGKIGNKIIGENPEVSEVKDGLTTHEQVTVYLESRPKWKHFNETDRNDFNKDGNPIYGYPNGFGLMQTDEPPANELQLWNWRANRELGQQILDDKYNRAITFPNRVRKTFPGATDFSTDEQIWKETHQRYRGGAYWQWEPNDPRDTDGEGKWVASPRENHTRGEDAWELYEDIQSENYPDGWN